MNRHYWQRTAQRCAVQDFGSHKVQHYLLTISYKIDICGSAIEVKRKNSTDLSWGAAPRSKSVEFFLFTSLVIELQRCENEGFHFHAAPLGTRSQLSDLLSDLTVGDCRITVRDCRGFLTVTMRTFLTVPDGGRAANDLHLYSPTAP